jgi:DNA primase
MLWSREVESASLDTPERRAAFEKRVHEVVRSIGDESVRKYYAQDFTARLRALLMPAPAQGRGERPRLAPGQANGSYQGRYSGQNRFGNVRDFPRGRPNIREPMAAPSARLSASPIVRGHRTALPAREALILMAAINHPWLLEQHSEEFAELEFLNPDADHLRRAVLDAVTGGGATDPQGLQAALAARGLTGVLDRVEAAITHTSDWPAQEGASVDDVAQWWTHVVTLHRKQRTLNRELKDAERALGEEPTDANLAWLRDVQGRLSALDGNEAQIEGFGLSSGRPARSF